MKADRWVVLMVALKDGVMVVAMAVKRDDLLAAPMVVWMVVSKVEKLAFDTVVYLADLLADYSEMNRDIHTTTTLLC